MQGKRTPDRVHVVRQPQNDDARSPEIIRALAQISDKLKRSEAERYELLAELREYRKALNELEDKADNAEKAYLSLEHKMNSRGKLEVELTERQARFEKNLKDTEEKLVKAVAGQAVLDKKYTENKDQFVALSTRVDEAAAAQVQLDRQIEKVADDKSRMFRKVERLEEIIHDTQETLKARAMVLLTDQSAGAQGGVPQIPAWLGNESAANDYTQAGLPWWRKSVRMQSVGMGALIVAALLSGWAINQIQQPEIPQIAILEGGGVAKLNFAEGRWEPVTEQGNALLPDDAALTQSVEQSTAPTIDDDMQAVLATAQDKAPVSADEELVDVIQQTPAAIDVLNADDEQLLAAMEENPDALAAQLNEIAPAAIEEEQSAIDAPEAQPSATITAPVANFEREALRQDPAVANAIAAEKGASPLSERMSRDTSLPPMVKEIEAQAYAGVPEAQHDLAAIYTAGHGGVAQNYEKAAFWFKEASLNGIANARYNLGVLYHQGLGVERNLDRALYWYREAARLNHPEAQYNLGIAHIEGIGTDYNPEFAAGFFEKAANQGIMEAAYNLGLIYENGLLGQTKPEEALLWYSVAADQGSDDAASAMRQLADTMGLSDEGMQSTIERMQSGYLAVTGHKAGPAST